MAAIRAVKLGHLFMTPHYRTFLAFGIKRTSSAAHRVALRIFALNSLIVPKKSIPNGYQASSGFRVDYHTIREF